MSTVETRRTIAITEAAAELGVRPDTVLAWAKAGHLAVFVPPGRELGDGKPGALHALIFRDDWERFLKSRTQTGAPGGKPEAPTAAVVGGAGTDGIDRRRRKRGGVRDGR